DAVAVVVGRAVRDARQRLGAVGVQPERHLERARQAVAVGIVGSIGRADVVGHPVLVGVVGAVGGAVVVGIRLERVVLQLELGRVGQAVAVGVSRRVD